MNRVSEERLKEIHEYITSSNPLKGEFACVARELRAWREATRVQFVKRLDEIANKGA